MRRWDDTRGPVFLGCVDCGEEESPCQCERQAMERAALSEEHHAGPDAVCAECGLACVADPTAMGRDPVCVPCARREAAEHAAWLRRSA